MREGKVKRELESTYFVQDRSNKDEMIRLQIQDQMLTEGMGGVLPEQEDLGRFQRVLDVGCGTGGWLIALAQAHPEIPSLFGADISTRMIGYAREQAERAGVADRVTFAVMDALRMLEFPRNSFDLVNQRLNFSYVRTWEWANLLHEYRRVSRPSAVVRITESNVVGTNTSPALTQLSTMALDAFYAAGHLFEHDDESIPRALPGMMRQQGIQHIQIREISFVQRPHDQGFTAYVEDITRLFRTILPFLRKWIKVPENYEEIYRQALADMRQPDFEATGKVVTVWGIAPL